MATILLSAAGLAAGGAIGGSVLGLSTAVIGRAVGAAVGRSIDARLLGRGSAPVETGRIDRFRLPASGEGRPMTRIWGAARVGGQVIWAGPFRESVTVSGGGGKGAARRPQVREYAYDVSLAIALCAGEISHVGRIWADGVEIARDTLALTVHRGTADQMPDPLIEAALGAGNVPAYRGTAYVVIEALDLGRFGNRVPQLSFEVFRPAPKRDDAQAEDIARLVRAVALIPGSGDYALATTPVFRPDGFAGAEPLNVHTVQGKADLVVSLDTLQGELPECGAVSLVVSWFGDDLRAGHCTVRPRAGFVTGAEPEAQPWRVSGTGRAQAGVVAQDSGRAVYGGTPSDASVIEAIRELTSRGLKVMFYPFLLMDQLPGNARPDPWSDAPDQPRLPWRGRITTAIAPGRPGTTDGTGAATAEVAAFFGTAQPGDFTPSGRDVTYHGPAEWSLRRMILHYAHLCALAGGVDAFCIASELRGVTGIRDDAGYPGVDALCALAADVRAILPGAKLTYAADWSEYAGHTPPGTGDRIFHLDALWSHPAIDAIGIDNYLPLSDWRDGDDHLDAAAGDIHDLDYLTANVAGGEYFDWYYASDEAREAQRRTPITDDQGEPWLWRLKDLKGWWENPHHNRVGGVRAALPTGWAPRSRPIWFTETGCAAIDKGTNEPNRFLDPKSSESALPAFSDGRRDDLMPLQHIRAIHRHFADPAGNPWSDAYGGRMVDMTRAHVWAWDARPFPAFPARGDIWGDAANYAHGHWLNGRASLRTLASVVREICAGAGVTAVDTDALHGVLRGYQVDDTDTARAMLQPLMLACGFDAVERDGMLRFFNRSGRVAAEIDPGALVHDPGAGGAPLLVREAEPELAGRVRLLHVEAEGAYAVASAESVLADAGTTTIAVHEIPLLLTRNEARQITARWLVESRVARDAATFILPPSRMALGPGDVVRLAGSPALWRIDRAEDGLARRVEAVRIEAESYRPLDHDTDSLPVTPPATAIPVEALFMDLPLLPGAQADHTPHVAMVARPWPGAVALWSGSGAGLAPELMFPRTATAGVTATPLFAARPGRPDRGPALLVQLAQGAPASVDTGALLSGANLAAIGDGSPDRWELFQFRDAELVAPDTWALRHRLRGQAGSDGVMPEDWPAGSRFVLLDGAVQELALPRGLLGVARRYAWGPAARPFDDPTWRAREIAFAGAGLRPWPPAHLRAAPAGGDMLVTWIRRSRIDGDLWQGLDVPLGEAREEYLLRVTVDGIIRREVVLTGPAFLYTAAMQAADGAGARVVQVAQVSASWGPGPSASLVLA
ncbi:MAG: glycoside hydrolase/phage tail family protein [Rubellimicrobium sp.]|nr:glycoside hydrolase/phage tail family protein [Rubellimicrobium sp.]